MNLERHVGVRIQIIKHNTKIEKKKQKAMEATLKALKKWGGDKDKITHVCSHSTTGWDVPGLSHHVIYNLDLPESARAIPVNYVGCQGGTSVLFVAASIAKCDPDAVCLAIAAEVL